MFQSWPHFSGGKTFPVPYSLHVPDGQDAVDPSHAYNSALGNMCDPDTEYGRLRIDLAEHCIKYLTELLESNDAKHKD